MKFKKTIFFIFLMFSIIFVGFYSTKIKAYASWSNVDFQPYSNKYCIFAVGIPDNAASINQKLINLNENYGIFYIPSTNSINYGTIENNSYLWNTTTNEALACIFAPKQNINNPNLLYLYSIGFVQNENNDAILTILNANIFEIPDNHIFSVASNAFVFRTTLGLNLGELVDESDRTQQLLQTINLYYINNSLIEQYGDFREKKGYQNGLALTPEEIENRYNNNITLWIRAIFTAITGFFSIRLGNITLGDIILIPFSITIVWFIIKQFRGGGD